MLEVGAWRFIFSAMLPAQRKKSSFATTAIFSRFPNKNPENATLAKKDFTSASSGFCKRSKEFAAAIQMT